MPVQSTACVENKYLKLRSLLTMQRLIALNYSHPQQSREKSLALAPCKKPASQPPPSAFWLSSKNSPHTTQRSQFSPLNATWIPHWTSDFSSQSTTDLIQYFHVPVYLMELTYLLTLWLKPFCWYLSLDTENRAFCWLVLVLRQNVILVYFKAMVTIKLLFN